MENYCEQKSLCINSGSARAHCSGGFGKVEGGREGRRGRKKGEGGRAVPRSISSANLRGSFLAFVHLKRAVTISTSAAGYWKQAS